jgi:phosphoglycerol transferase MdoB-like AlkP superfamily enzyme
MSFLRLVFVFAFKPVDITWSKMGPAFMMGLQYDMRVVCGLLFPLLLIASIKRCNPFESVISRKIITWVLGIFIIVLSFFYSIDFAHFSYLSQRLNAQALNYIDDKAISLNMVWQSYPVIKIIAGLILFTAGLLWLIRLLYKRNADQYAAIKKANRLGWSFFFGLLFAVAIFGRVGQYPLRWSDAFALGNDFEANTALNPVQSFFSTLNFRKSAFDLKKVKQYYSLMADQLELQQQDSVLLNYERVCKGNDSLYTTKPNIVLVICESFSGYKSSMWGNPLNTTPYFAQLCKDGAFFSRCFTPAYGTARGVWATITGIPDVWTPKTASRNPIIVDQATILNDFKGYEKMYFLGGSASWANIRGLLKDNIEGLHLYEEQDYKSPRLDVWGISDKNLFLEANEIIDKQKTPFFAIIQTAGNHRPYTIPKEDRADFKSMSFPHDTLKKYGFESIEELNAFRYTDYCYQQFFEAARKKKYFDNTVFVFVGDHGIRGYAGDMFPKAWTEQALTCEHVPLLFYSPGKIKPQAIDNISSQTDVLATIASLTGIPYHNTALGRNLFDSATLNHPDNIKNCAFIIDQGVNQIGLVTNKYYYLRSLISGKEEMVSVIDNKPIDNSPEQIEKMKFSRQLTDAYFETSRYLLFNNKKKRPVAK